MVDLEGFEPSSKRGNHKLSTCLSPPSIFEHKQDRSHPFVPYPLNCRKGYEEKPELFPILLRRYVKRFGKRAFERRLVPTSNVGIKPVYYTSTRQREHNYFRQIIFDN